MTLRDRFAIAALVVCAQGLFGPERVAAHAYVIADAMLAAREAPGEGEKGA